MHIQLNGYCVIKADEAKVIYNEEKVKVPDKEPIRIEESNEIVNETK